MHKYQPRIHLVLRREGAINAPITDLEQEEFKTFIFPECVFTAVTAYQNQLVSTVNRAIDLDTNSVVVDFGDRPLFYYLLISKIDHSVERRTFEIAQCCRVTIDGFYFGLTNCISLKGMSSLYKGRWHIFFCAWGGHTRASPTTDGQSAVRDELRFQPN
jgi:hypothetical protein